MKKIAILLVGFVLTMVAESLTMTAAAQTLNVVTGNVTYAFPAAKAGDMTYDGGTKLTICGKTFAIKNISKIYVDKTAVIDNTVSVAYSGTSAKVTVAGNVAQYITTTIDGAHVKVEQSNTDDVDGKEITYSLSGSSDDGEFYMSGKYKATIDLNGVTLTNATPVFSGAALHVQNGKRIEISAKKDTKNTLTDCANLNEESNQKACLYVKGHAEFKGKGTLTVRGQYKHAIKAGEYISVKNCTINVTGAVGDAFNCNEYFLMESGTINISGVGDDGIQCEVDGDVDKTGETKDHEDENSGNLYIADGTISIQSTADASKGIKADGDVNISGGNISVATTGGTIIEYEVQEDGSQTFSSTTACSGIKADGDTNISGGTITLTATGGGGKGMSGDNALNITGGTINVKTSGYIVYHSNGSLRTATSAQNVERISSNAKSSPKGMKFDGAINIGGGTLNIEAMYHEAIEAKGTLNITDGIIYATSGDDAINSGDVMTIDGGTTCAYSTGNDGLDANADCYIKGGNVYAVGSTTPEVGIDALERRTLSITGGNIVAIGGLESGASVTINCQQLGTSSSGGGGWNRPGPGGPGGNTGTKQWSANTWYALYNGNTLAFAFKTPSSGGNALVVCTSGTPTLYSKPTVSGDTIWQGMGATSDVSGGTAASLTTYSSGGGFR